MKDVIVFSHMMKTAGSSLINSFIEYYGKQVLDVTEGTRLRKKLYTNSSLETAFHKKNNKVKIIVGHAMRPCIHFDIPNVNFRWVTFLRNPVDRYVSNYFYMYHLKNKFQLSYYSSMKEINIVEWEKVDNFSNYQCRFICGEANAEKAIQILESKFEWVGITEEFDEGIKSLKSHFNLHDLFYNSKKSNPNKTSFKEIAEAKEKYRDFITEVNQEDIKLYNYVKEQIWPKHKKNIQENTSKPHSKPLKRMYNRWSYHIENQLKFKKTKITKESVLKFYNRCFK